MRKYVILLLSILSTVCYSQVTSQTKEINAIKADSCFLSAESTVKDWETAYDNARILLSREIEDWLNSQGIKEISGVIANSNEHILEIKTTRGSLYRAFVYVKKSDLLAYTDKSKVMVVDIPIVKDSIDVRLDSLDQITEKTENFARTDIENDMLLIKEATDIKSFILANQQSGKISVYGKYSNLPEDGVFYIFIYNKEGKVPACLKYSNGACVNLETGKREIISDKYQGCGAIWFK